MENLKVYYVNIRGLKSKMESLARIIDEGVVLIAVKETPVNRSTTRM